MAVRTLLGAAVVLITGAVALGCDTGRVLGETCTRDDQCATGVCVGGKCRAPLILGTEPVDAAEPEEASTEDAGPDAEPDAGTDAEPDVAPEAEPQDAPADTAPDVGEDTAPADAPDDTAASDGGADA